MILVQFSAVFASIMGVTSNPLSIDDVRSAIAAERGKIHVLRVRCSSSMDRAIPTYRISIIEEVTASTDGRARIEPLQVGWCTKSGDVVFKDATSIIATNLDSTIILKPVTGWANIQSGTSEAARTSGIDWFTMNLYNPQFASLPAFLPSDLQELANIGHARIRQELESVNGRVCHVLEVPSAPDTPPVIVAWIDVDRSCTVLQWQLLNMGEPSIEYRAQQQLEVQPGIWVIAKGTKHVELDGVPIVSLVQIDPHHGQPRIEINPFIEDSWFTPSIPTGYRVRGADGTFMIQP